MMQTKIFSILLIGSILVTGCELLDDSPCGTYETTDMYLLGSSIVDSTTGLYYSYMDGNDRVFQWSHLQENVCASEHIKTDARVAVLDETTQGINTRARLSWYFLYEKNITMNRVGSDFKGNGEAGLKQAFDMDPGWFIQTIEVYFPTMGSYYADTAFLKAKVISVEMMTKYRRH